MRYCGEVKGKTRDCPRCEGKGAKGWDNTYLAQSPDGIFNQYSGKMENTYSMYFARCPYCAGLGYKEVEY